MDVLDLLAAAELIDNVIDEREQFENQTAHRDFLLYAEVDQLPVEAPPHRPPLVLLNKGAPVEAEPHVLFIELVQLRDNSLNQGGEADDLIDARRDVTDADFEGREEGMRPDVPPYLFRVIDAPGLDEQADVVLV